MMKSIFESYRYGLLYNHEFVYKVVDYLASIGLDLSGNLLAKFVACDRASMQLRELYPNGSEEDLVELECVISEMFAHLAAQIAGIFENLNESR